VPAQAQQREIPADAHRAGTELGPLVVVGDQRDVLEL
jgi:hypothetical protein